VASLRQLITDNSKVTPLNIVIALHQPITDNSKVTPFYIVIALHQLITDNSKGTICLHMTSSLHQLITITTKGTISFKPCALSEPVSADNSKEIHPPNDLSASAADSKNPQRILDFTVFFSN
jgi:hypothetical protein